MLYHRVPKLFADLALARGDGRYARVMRSLNGAQLLKSMVLLGSRCPAAFCTSSSCAPFSSAVVPLFQHLRLFDRRLRNVSQRPNVSQPRSNSRSTDRPPSHELTKG